MVVEALRNALKEDVSSVKNSAASALGNLGKKLPAGSEAGLVDALLSTLTDQQSDSFVKRWAASELGSLGEKLPVKRATGLIDALLRLLKDKESDSDVKRSAVDGLAKLTAKASSAQIETFIIALSSIFLNRERDSEDAKHFLTTLRTLTRAYSGRKADAWLNALEDRNGQERTLAVNVLPRRELSPEQVRRITVLRDDSQHRPWVRMAALDTLAEIVREKEAQELDKKKAEEAARASP